jgi:hypothetical protein
MHYAAVNISATIQSSILAVVMFGDPALNFPTPALGPVLQSRLWENCAMGDPVRRALFSLENADCRRYAGTARPSCRTCRTVFRESRS